MIKKLDHIGIAVKDMENGLNRWKTLLNSVDAVIEEIPERGIKAAHLEIPGGGSVELVEPLTSDSPVAKFLETRGEGIHHLCFEVEDLEAAMKDLKEKGIRFMTDRPVCGAGGSRIVFAHPRDLGGVLVELKEKAEKISLQPE
ncbi:MAG: methylmalonyl-CoA epimerase [Candidatus Aminicenantes bacterium]|nr:methylmalonyl-CoA epimerase [Candidatus Aminicenantes bacterium]